jgi:hypothetical protein
MKADSSLLVSSPSELVAALPYLMGYHPNDSVVLVGRRGRDLDFSACFDLPPPGLDEDAARDATREIAAGVLRQQPDSMVVIGYGPRRRVTPAVLRVAETFRTFGVCIDDVLRVDEGRWWSYLCDEPRCCPPEGNRCLPPDSVIAAEATYLGQVALPSRRDLIAQVAAVEGPARAAMVVATEEARRRFGELLAGDRAVKRIRQAGRIAVREAEKRYRSGAPLPDDRTAWLGVLLADTAVEDYALDRTGRNEWRVGLWTDVLRRVEPVYVPAPACLLAFTAWQIGRGALARVAVDRALAAEPGHELAGILHQLLGFGISPGMLSRNRRER